MLTIRSHEAPLPTLPGKVEGIVGTWGRVTTVQCAACLRTATGSTPAQVVRTWNHAPSEGESREPTPYKRCPDCRAAGLHPEQTPFDAT